MLECYLEIDVVVGMVIVVEVVMGEGCNLKMSFIVVSFYFLYQVYRGLKWGRVIMVVSD